MPQSVFKEEQRSDLTRLSATAVAELISTKRVSSEEVVRAYLNRINAVNPKLNAVVQLRPEAALSEAKAADESLARGINRGALHGVPITIKDSFDTSELISTAGSKGRRSYVPKESATVVARLQSAGAILLGKTNTPDLTMEGETDNLIYGRTNNPFDLARTPGGSSGGAAAIIAAGGSPLDIGSDTGGSLRQPVHYCGIAGLKPTAGRVPRTGHIISFDGPLQSLTQIGPLARSVDDLALALSVIAGPDGRDPFVVPVALRDYRAVSLNGLRVAFYTDNEIAPSSPETMKAVKAAVRLLAEAGGKVIEACPPGVEQSMQLWLEVLSADGFAWMDRLLEQAGTTESRLLAIKEPYKPVSSAEYSRRFGQWDRWRSRMLSFIENYDLIVCPVNAGPAPLHGNLELPGLSYSMTFNLTGWPSVIVRTGTSKEGLPIGVQVVAQAWREDVALAAAKHLEMSLGPWQPPLI